MGEGEIHRHQAPNVPVDAFRFYAPEP
jgi:hypothetical protein